MSTIPLPERVRPRSLAALIGQQHLLGEGAPLRQAVDQNLAQLLLKAVHGEPIEVTVRNPNIEFAADGATWVNRR